MEGRAEVGGPAIGLVVRGGIHLCLLAIATADSMQGRILYGNLDGVEASR